VRVCVRVCVYNGASYEAAQTPGIYTSIYIYTYIHIYIYVYVCECGGVCVSECEWMCVYA